MPSKEHTGKSSSRKGLGNATSIAADLLRSLVSRIERLEEEKRATSADIKEVYEEAKGNGFDAKALKEVIKRRAMDRDERELLENLVDTYSRALGDLPLFASAAE